MKILMVWGMIIFSLSCVFFVNQCTSQLYIPTLNHSNKHDVVLAELIRGRSIYLKKCSGCHQLYLPTDYNANVWEEQVHEMQDEAQINQEETRLILQYLTSHKQ